MARPRVSVIVPSYNHSPYLKRRVESILAQTFSDFELILLDDASTDDSLEKLVAHYRHAGVRLMVNTKNSGSAFPQWERGIALAKGEYVWIAESDDSADPIFLERLVQTLDANPRVALAYCQSRLIDKQHRAIGDSRAWTQDLDPHRWSASFFNQGIDEIRNYLVKKNTIPNASAVLCRRSTLLDCLPMDASFRLCGDWLHWGKVLWRSDVAYIAEPLNDWRCDSSNSRTQAPGVLEWQEGQQVVRQLATMAGFSQREVRSLLQGFAERCVDWYQAAASRQPQMAAH
jgi:glycosyltransferase involved in cell wall biosynthesis